MAKKSKSVSHTDEVLSQAFDSPLAQNAKFKKELQEVQMYYEFFDGFDPTDLNSDYGQTWKINEDEMGINQLGKFVTMLDNLLKNKLDL